MKTMKKKVGFYSAKFHFNSTGMIGRITPCTFEWVLTLLALDHRLAGEKSAWLAFRERIFLGHEVLLCHLTAVKCSSRWIPAVAHAGRTYHLTCPINAFVLSSPVTVWLHAVTLTLQSLILQNRSSSFILALPHWDLDHKVGIALWLFSRPPGTCVGPHWTSI